MSSHLIELTTCDGEQVGFSCDDGQTLLAAAEASGLFLPAQCRQGSCGACAATVTEGRYALGPHVPEALPKGEGAILMCRTVPRSPLRIRAPFGRERILSQPVPRRTAVIEAITPLNDSVTRLTLQLMPDDELGTAAQFEPGQFMELEVPGSGLKRAYSLSNLGNWDGSLEFMIRRHPQGRFSAYLQEEARPGKILTVHGPQGAFTLRESGLRPRWFVAGGTGLAPMLAMLRRMADWQEPQPARLFFGVTSESELFAADILEELASALPQLQVTLCVWKPRADWAGFSGTPAEALRQALAGTAAKPDIYVCGPPVLIEQSIAAGCAGGVPEEQIFSERFVAG